MKKLLVSVLIVLTLSACNKTPEEKIQEDKQREEALVSLVKENTEQFKHPQLVGTTLNGSEIMVVEVKHLCIGCSYPQTHYVYMVGDVTSDNYQVSSGKTTRNQVDVTLSKEPTASEVINEADRLKKVIEEQEYKEYERLKKKFKD